MIQGPSDERLAFGRLTDEQVRGFLAAVQTLQPVVGYTHNFYRYPARFSPLFARATIEAFSRSGDVVLDPFMGGATTLVEARAAAATHSDVT